MWFFLPSFYGSKHTPTTRVACAWSGLFATHVPPHPDEKHDHTAEEKGKNHLEGK